MSKNQTVAAAGRSRANPIADAVGSTIAGKAVDADTVPGPLDGVNTSIPQAMSEMNLQKAFGPNILRHTERNIEGFLKAQGAVTAAEEGLKKANISQSRFILKIAHEAETEAKGPGLYAVSVFLGMCDHAERYAKESLGTVLSKTAKNWSIYRGQISRAMLAGIKTHDSDSIYDLNKVFAEAVAASAAGTSTGTRSAPAMQLDGKLLELSDKLRTSIQLVFNNVCPFLNEEEQDQFGEELGTLAGRYAVRAQERITKEKAAADKHLPVKGMRERPQASAEA